MQKMGSDGQVSIFVCFYFTKVQFIKFFLSSFSALHIACRSQNLPIAYLLIQAGADPKVGNQQNTTPLHYLVRVVEKPSKSRKGSFKNLKDYFSKDINNVTYSELIELLIDKGVDVDTKTFIDETPLMQAARSGNEEAVKVLLKRNANRTLANKLKFFGNFVSKLLNTHRLFFFSLKGWTNRFQSSSRTWAWKYPSFVSSRRKTRRP